MSLQEHYRARYRLLRSEWRDSLTVYRECVEQLVCPTTRLLDVGCGHADVLTAAYATSAQAVGVEYDLRALLHPSPLHQKVNGSGTALPFACESFDLIVLAWVLEHLDHPPTVLAELARVLAPGGRIVFLTPNVWNYNVWIIRAIPNWLHPLLTRRLYGRQEHDTYPVRYRANSPRRINSLFSRAGLVQEQLILNGDPSYISFTPRLFDLACGIEALLDRPELHWARVHLIGIYRKPLTGTIDAAAN